MPKRLCLLLSLFSLILILMDAVDEVKSRLSIEDVISEYVQLKRAGRNWRGLSPFTNERTPSFMVSPEKQIWHDFSSGKGGNMFSFVMEMEGVEFKDALQILARKAGVDLEQYSRGPRRRGPNKERLYELLEATTHFYQVQFSQSSTALGYVLKKRKFSKETALEFRLGYAPNTGNALVKFLQSKSFSPEEIQAAGVATKRYRDIADMFRGRLMIPLQDPQGRVIGFTARLLEDLPNSPKYINTPQTVLYDKSRHVYGLHLAKQAIRKSQFVVVAEGNLDVIASHQAGVRQVVATAGTALTEQHLKALSRFTGDIRLAFDQDKAGLQATERAIPIASKTKVSLSIISVPSGKDPDELIQQNPALWQKATQDHQYALDWLIDRYKNLLDITSAEGKRQFSDVILPIVRGLADPVEQDHYVSSISETLKIDKEALMAKLNNSEGQKRTGLRPKKVTPKPVDRQVAENSKAQNHFLALVLMHPPLRSYMEPIIPEMLFSNEARTLFEFLKTNPDFEGEPTKAKELRDIAESVKILALQYEELYQGLDYNELQYEVARLQARLIENFVKNQKQTIVAKLQEADEQSTEELLVEAKRLDSLLKQIKRGLYGEEK